MADDNRLRTALLAASDDLQIRPTLVDDVRRGARQRRRRIAYLAAGATAIAVLATTVTAYSAAQHRPIRHPNVPAASAPVNLPGSCRPERLPEPGGQVSSFVTGADRSGRFLLGRSQDAQGTLTVLIWRDGKLVTTASMPGADGTLDDINGSGVAIGNSVPDGGGNTPWLFRDGEFTELTVQNRTVPATAAAIGEQGTVVGWWDTNPMLHTPVVWQPGQTTGTELDLGAGRATTGRALDVDSDGVIVGDVYSPIMSNAGALWRPGGKSELLPQVKYGVNQFFIEPSSIGGGVIAGRVNRRPAVLDLRTGTATVLDKAVEAGATNGKAWFAGRDGGELALVSRTGRTRLPMPSDGDLSSDATLVKTISDDGRVIGGQVADKDGNSHAVVWRCG